MPGIWIELMILQVWQVKKMAQVLNKPEFCILHGCMYKCYTEIQICLIIAPYSRIIPEYALISLNKPERWLDIAE